MRKPSLIALIVISLTMSACSALSQRSAAETPLVVPSMTALPTKDKTLDTAASKENSVLPPATINNDEGSPEVITGEWNYTSPLVLTHFQEPVAALVNVTPYVLGNWTDWVPLDQQILGRITSPMSSSPVSYKVMVPRQVEGAGADLDNDGEQDAGVQIYGLWVASNITGDSYLHQMDQTAYRSYLLDPNSGTFRRGTFLVYAPDDSQGFPSSAGEDAIFPEQDTRVIFFANSGSCHIGLYFLNILFSSPDLFNQEMP